MVVTSNLNVRNGELDILVGVGTFVGGVLGWFLSFLAFLLLCFFVFFFFFFLRFFLVQLVYR